MKETQEKNSVLTECNSLLRIKSESMQDKCSEAKNHTQAITGKNVNIAGDSNQVETPSANKLQNIEDNQITADVINLNMKHKHEQNKSFPAMTNLGGETNNKPESENLNEFKTVRYKNRRKKVRNVGTHTAEDENSFKSTKPIKKDKRLWLFISKAQESVEEKHIQEYIANKSKYEKEDISVSALNTKPMEDNSKCFMVGVPLDMKETVYSNEFWPVGIRFERFSFYRGNHFLEQNAGEKEPHTQ